MRRIAGIVLAVAGLAAAGCGYTLVGRASNIPPDIKSVYLAQFENKTDRVQVDQILTQAVADELVTRQRFALVPGASGADAEMVGTITNFDVRPVSFDDDRRATEYEIVITVSAALRRRPPSEEVLWQNDRYQFRDSYQLEASELGFEDRETPAIEATAKKFAESMVTDLFEGF